MHNFTLQTRIKLSISFFLDAFEEKTRAKTILCANCGIYITKWNSLVHINYHELILLFAIIKS